MTQAKCENCPSGKCAQLFGRPCKCKTCKELPKISKSNTNRLQSPTQSKPWKDNRLVPLALAFVKIVGNNDLSDIKKVWKSKYVKKLEKQILYKGMNTLNNNQPYSFWTKNKEIAKTFGEVYQIEYTGSALCMETLYSDYSPDLKQYKNSGETEHYKMVADALGNHHTERDSFIIENQELPPMIKLKLP